MEYTGTWNEETWNATVKIGSKNLPVCLDKWNHSPDGFSWGYNGSGPAQLAKAMLYDFAKRTGIDAPEDFAENFGFKFRNDFIARIPLDEPWMIDDETIGMWLKGDTLMRVKRDVIQFVK